MSPVVTEANFQKKKKKKKKKAQSLILSMLGTTFSRRQLNISFFYFFQQMDFDNFAWNVKAYFLGENKKYIKSSPSAFTQRVVMVKR